MKVIPTPIPGLLILEPKLFGDRRGFFTELYNAERYREAGVATAFVQDNLSRSRQNVLRGLHIQNPNSQGKLVTVLRGAVLDVAVDVRVGSPTFGQHFKIELNEDNRRQFWVPRGFAHGFRVLSDSADFYYKCDALYSPADELVIKWNDPDLNIEWGITDPELSARDRAGTRFSDLHSKLPVF